MDEAAEHVVANDMAGGRIDVWALRISRDGEAQASVRPVPVVMADVLAKNLLEVAASGDQAPVEAFGSHGPDPTLRDRVCPGRADRGLDDLDALGAEHLLPA
jgi:hypothetical protein